MAENSRTQTKAAIKRASLKARTLANKLDRQALDELTQLYEQAISFIIEAITNAGDDEGNLRLEVLDNLLEQTTQRLDAMSKARDSLLDDRMIDAASLASNVFNPSVVADLGIVVTQVAHDAVLQAKRFIAADGLQLSDRLWRIDNHAKQVVGDAIQSAIIQGHSATRAALDFISTGQAVPPELASKMNSANARIVGRQVVNELMKKEGSPYANALRVFRTEINRAHGNAYQSSAFNHPDVIGTRFLLSPNHPAVDICDMHAKANLYGLGSGVYPKDKNPWPAHPNTLSYVEAVFSDEISDEDEAGKTDRITWLQQQSVTRQNAILGQHKAWMLREDRLRENAINTPWSILKKRLEGAGVDLPVFRITRPVSELPPFGSTDKPVSHAFVVSDYKKNVEHALRVIDSVHTDGVLPVIPIKKSNSSKFYGMYERIKPEFGDQSVQIMLSSWAPDRELTLAHEIGHFIDHKGFPGVGMSSTEHELFKNWRKVVSESPEIQTFKMLRDNGPNAYIINGVRRNKSELNLEYYLREREIWARSYAQWIATKSGDKLMLSQLNTIIEHEKRINVPYSTQWSDDNFKPIAEAMEKLFKQMGWIT